MVRCLGRVCFATILWRVATVTVLALLLGACGGELAPRRSATGAVVGVVETYESPRRIVVVESDVDPGEIEVPALVNGTNPVEVVAPDDGLVFDVLIAAGGDVAAGQPVMSFLPAASRAEELEVSILELERELATETNDAQGLLDIDAQMQSLQASWESRSITLEAPMAGTLTGTREGLELRVRAGRTLFTVSSPESLAVTVQSAPSVVEPLSIGDIVTVRRATAGAQAVDGRVVSFEDAEDLVRTRIEFVSPITNASIEIGNRVMVGFDVVDEPAANGTTWVRAEALRRSDGRSFLLIEADGARVERFDTEVRRRTDTHVLVTDPRRRLAPGTALILP